MNDEGDSSSKCECTMTGECNNMVRIWMWVQNFWPIIGSHASSTCLHQRLCEYIRA